LKSKLLRSLSLSFISVIIFFTAAEIITRLFWNTEIEDPHQGVILSKTNRNVVYKGIEYRTNSLGLRNKEIPFKKDSNAVRILALGDSFIWGEGLNENESITTKIESILKNKKSKNIEVINAGIGGYNTKDEYEQLVRLYPSYNPDLIIQFFFTNDLLTTDESNEIDNWTVNTHMFLRKNSKFYSFLYYIIKITLNAENQFPSFILPSEYFNLDDTKPGWVNFKKYTLQIKDFCINNNLNFCFVLIPTLTNLDSNYPYFEIQQKVTEYVDSKGFIIGSV